MVELVSLNKTGKTLALKRSHNFESLFKSGLIAYLKDRYEEPKAIVVFGSYADGTDTSESDIDIAVISKGKEIDLKKFEKKLCRKINLLILDRVPKKFKNSLANGIVLDGYLRLE